MLATKLIWEDVPVDERIVRLIVEHEKDIVSEVLNRLTYSYHVDDKWLAYCKMQETAVMAWMKRAIENKQQSAEADIGYI